MNIDTPFIGSDSNYRFYINSHGRILEFKKEYLVAAFIIEGKIETILIHNDKSEAYIIDDNAQIISDFPYEKYIRIMKENNSNKHSI